MKYEEFQKLKNLRPIARDEIVLDCDNKKDLGDIGIKRMCLMMSADGYRIELWRAVGMKSYHAHLKGIPHIAELPKDQNKKYKELLIKKYISEVRELIEAPELEDIDFSLCIPDHLIAEENKPHYRHKNIKKLIAVINNETAYHASSEGLTKNFCDVEIYSLATSDQSKIKRPGKNYGNTLASQIASKISILSIADQFGLSPQGSKLRTCVFHADTNPSLSLNEELGLFHCFGCHVSGNIIKFYAMLKELTPEFKIKK